MLKSVLLLLLAGCLLVSLASATLSNAFVNDNLGNVVLPNPSAPPGLSYQLNSLKLNFDNAVNYTLEFSGVVHQTPGPVTYVSSGRCTGGYVLAGQSSYEIMFSLYGNAPLYCTESLTNVYGFCPWICSQFGGTWQALFSPNNTNPNYLTINPVTSGTNWGLLPTAIPLLCNASSCGSPPVFPVTLPTNSSASFWVRFLRFCCMWKCTYSLWDVAGCRRLCDNY